MAFGGQRRGQVGGHRRLADAALAGGDADHVLHLRQRALRQLAAAERLLEVAFLLVGEDVEADRDRGHAFELGDVLGDGLFEVGADRAAGGGQRDDDLDAAVLLDLDRADHAQLDDRAPQLGVDDGAQLLGDLVFRGKWHWLDSRKGGGSGAPGGESLRPPGPWVLGTHSSEGGPMSGTRIAVGRIVALGVLLALSVLLLAAAKAEAGKYAVAQCGWYVGADAELGRHHRRRQVPPRRLLRAAAGGDPFDGVHMKSLTRDGQGTVSGTRFARWRWDRARRDRDHRRARHLVARPPRRDGAAPRQRRRRRRLHPFAHRRHAPTPRCASSATGSRRRSPAFEDRLLCARAESKWCSLEPGSWSALRALTLTVEDDDPPTAGSAAATRSAAAGTGATRPSSSGGVDGGAGRPLRRDLSSTAARVGLTEYPCAKAMIGGEWRATTMRPCPTDVCDPPLRRHHRLQRRPPHARRLRDRLRRQPAAAPRPHGPDRQQPAGPPARRCRSPAAKAGGGSTTSTSAGKTRTRARRARSAAPSGGSPARQRLRHRRQVRRRPRPPHPRRPQRPGRGRLLAAAVAARRGRQRGAELGGDGAAALRRRQAGGRLRRRGSRATR